MAKKVWTRDMIIQQIQALCDGGRDLRHGQAQVSNPRLTSAAIRYFGSWKEAVLASGIDYGEVEKRSEQSRIEKITKWSPERVLEQIRQLAESGEDLRSIVVRNKYPSLFSAATSRRYFASWGKAVEQAGISYQSIRGRRKTKKSAPRGGWHRELVLEAIAELLPSPNVPARQAKQLHPHLYEEAVKGFGSWKAAREVAAKLRS